MPSSSVFVIGGIQCRWIDVADVHSAALLFGYSGGQKYFRPHGFQAVFIGPASGHDRYVGQFAQGSPYARPNELGCSRDNGIRFWLSSRHERLKSG